MIDAGGHMVAIGSGTEKERPFARRAAAARERAHMALDRKLARMAGQARDRPIEPRFGGHIGEQIVDRRRADRAEHRRAVIGSEREITHEKLRSGYGRRSKKRRKIGERSAKGGGRSEEHTSELPSLLRHSY